MAERGPMGAWEPIETAPMDGTEVLVWNASAENPRTARCMRSLEDGGEAWVIARSIGQRAVAFLFESPTHWMPLPSPPPSRRRTPMPDTDTRAMRERTVADIPDAVLIERACRGVPTRTKWSGQPRWSFIGAQFGLGCTYSHQLCRRFGLDPDERVRKVP